MTFRGSAASAPGPSSSTGAERLEATFTPAYRGGSGPPLVCLHGFTDTWRTWELVLPALERRHDDWVVLDGVGHCPQLDVPLEAAQLILGFTSQ